MSKLESAILSMNRLSIPSRYTIPALAVLIVTLTFIITVLSVPLETPQILIWFAIFPIIQSEISGIGFSNVFIKSLWVLPIIIAIGIFNPILDREIVYSVGNVQISQGWLSFISITLRGLLTVQAVILLTLTSGFYDMCNALRKLGCPKILVTQIQFTYRYILVILEEASNMERAIKSRGFGRKSYPLTLWGRIIGQLLIRSYERAIRIHNAMLSRGFNGVMPDSQIAVIDWKSIIFIIVWILVFIILRFESPSKLF